MSQAKLDISLPEASSGDAPQSLDSIEIFVDSAGRMLLGNSDPVEVSEQNVVDLLSSLAEVTEDTLVLIYADADARHEDIVFVLSGLAKLELEKVHLMTDQTANPGGLD